MWMAHPRLLLKEANAPQGAGQGPALGFDGPHQFDEPPSLGEVLLTLKATGDSRGGWASWFPSGPQFVNIIFPCGAQWHKLWGPCIGSPAPFFFFGTPR